MISFDLTLEVFRPGKFGLSQQMSSQAVPREVAQGALDELMVQVAPDAKSKETPFEYLKDTATTDEVKRQWFAVSLLEIKKVISNK